MSDISVGQVSGLIAAGVFVLQILLPLALPVLLAAYIAERNSVVTWSVLGRFLHTSLWPTILRTDTAAASGVSKRVSNVGFFQTAVLGLISLASIITPLGLYDTVTPNDGTSIETFHYLRDPSPFGYGTPPRSTAPFVRSCGLVEPCPGRSKTSNCTVLPSGFEICNSTIDRTIPKSLTDLFQDGASKFADPVSSMFDIQWRTHLNGSDPMSSLGYYLRSAMRPIATLILEPGLHVVEGVIVDTVNGGIGFRNHTGPAAKNKYGSAWSEDILFVEPETQCVNLNFSFHFELEELNGKNAPVAVTGLYIKDEGGFSALNRTAPVETLRLPPGYNGQGDIDLRDRAYKAAWLNNYMTLVYFNKTNPEMNDITRLDAEPGMEIHSNSSVTDSKGFTIAFQSLRTSAEYGEYLVLNKSLTSGNPYNVSRDQFASVVNQCSGLLDGESANINSSIVGCGLLYGAAQRTDNGQPFVPDPGSKWKVPVYSCASSVKARIRTVHFQYNGTDLSRLNATSSTAKKYADPSELPLWGVEDMHEYAIGEAQPLWGVLGRSNATVDESLRTNISTVVKEHLRLPGMMSPQSELDNGRAPLAMKTGQNLPGADFYNVALWAAFLIAKPEAGLLYGDYSGQTSLGLFAKWQSLSKSAATASQVINLVWTDIAANLVVGTKGWGLRAETDGLTQQAASNQVSVPVTAYRKIVRYRVPYAVPAFVVLGVALAILVAFVALLAMKRTGFAKLRMLIDSTSAGRLMALHLWPEEGLYLQTDTWVKSVGKHMVTASASGLTLTDDETKPAAEDSQPENAEMENLVTGDEEKDDSVQLVSEQDPGRSG